MRNRSGFSLSSDPIWLQRLDFITFIVHLFHYPLINNICIIGNLNSSLIRRFVSSYIHLFILHLNCLFHPDVRKLFETMQGDAWWARIFGENIFWQNNRLVLIEILALVVQNNNFHRFKVIWCECFHCHSSKKR